MKNLDKVLTVLGLSENDSQLIREGVELDVANKQEEYKKQFETQQAEERKKEEETKLNFSKMGLRARQELYINNRELYNKLRDEERSQRWN